MKTFKVLILICYLAGINAERQSELECKKVDKNVKPKISSNSVLLGYEEKDKATIWGCAAVLISEKYILTSSHCSKGVKYVKLDDSRILNVEKIITHPGFKPPSIYNDISLIKLVETVPADLITPACIQTTKDISKLNSFIDMVYSLKKETQFVKNVNATLVPHNECDELYIYLPRRELANGIREESQICVYENYEDGKGKYFGGPLLVKNEFGKVTVIGLGSFGMLSHSANIYTRISHYASWIEENVWHL